jgi:hypothetical protein
MRCGVRSYVVLLILLFTVHTSIFLSYLCITISSLNRSHRPLNECFLSMLLAVPLQWLRMNLRTVVPISSTLLAR